VNYELIAFDNVPEVFPMPISFQIAPVKWLLSQQMKNEA
jgi:hypothetical protein